MFFLHEQVITEFDAECLSNVNGPLRWLNTRRKDYQVRIEFEALSTQRIFSAYVQFAPFTLHVTRASADKFYTFLLHVPIIIFIDSRSSDVGIKHGYVSPRKIVSDVVSVFEGDHATNGRAIRQSVRLFVPRPDALYHHDSLWRFAV